MLEDKWKEYKHLEELDNNQKFACCFTKAKLLSKIVSVKKQMPLFSDSLVLWQAGTKSELLKEK